MSYEQLRSHFNLDAYLQGHDKVTIKDINETWRIGYRVLENIWNGTALALQEKMQSYSPLSQEHLLEIDKRLAIVFLAYDMAFAEPKIINSIQNSQDSLENSLLKAFFSEESTSTVPFDFSSILTHSLFVPVYHQLLLDSNTLSFSQALINTFPFSTQEFNDLLSEQQQLDCMLSTFGFGSDYDLTLINENENLNCFAIAISFTDQDATEKTIETLARFRAEAREIDFSRRPYLIGISHLINPRLSPALTRVIKRSLHLSETDFTVLHGIDVDTTRCIPELPGGIAYRHLLQASLLSFYYSSTHVQRFISSEQFPTVGVITIPTVNIGR